MFWFFNIENTIFVGHTKLAKPHNIGFLVFIDTVMVTVVQLKCCFRVFDISKLYVCFRLH